jgi:hypothetical protein
MCLLLVRHNCNTIKKFLTSLFWPATVQSPSTKEYSKVKITLDDADIKDILTSHIKRRYGSQFELEELRGYSYTTTAVFVEAEEDEAQDDDAL